MINEVSVLTNWTGHIFAQVLNTWSYSLFKDAIIIQCVFEKLEEVEKIYDWSAAISYV